MLARPVPSGACSGVAVTRVFATIMVTGPHSMEPFELILRTRLVCGPDSIGRLGELSLEIGMTRPLLVADHGLVASGHIDRALAVLGTAGIDVVPFHDFDVNPDSSMVTRGSAVAERHGVDAIIGLGGGSSLDCAKGINFLVTNGGVMSDYRGYGKAPKPMLPMLGVPTTAGTGSEAQSYAVIADTDTHVKMACGAPGAAFRVALLDPALTISQPAPVTAAAGFDAIAHAVETAVTTRRTPVSRLFSDEAFRLLNTHVERVLAEPGDLEARSSMQLGAFYAGVAIEHSMLGAAHACANPLTARYAMPHGMALSILLPHVVRWNARGREDPYRAFVTNMLEVEADGDFGDHLAARLVEISKASGFPDRLRDTGVLRNDLERLARDAGEQWTGTFNPRPFGASEALEVYVCAY